MLRAFVGQKGRARKAPLATSVADELSVRRRTMHLLARGALLVLVLGSTPAFGQAPAPNHAQLQYGRPSTFAACPEESFFRDFVAARLGGLDPFTASAPRRITLTLSRPKRNFVAMLAMYDQAGKRLGGDELAEPNCASLVENAGRTVVSWLVPIVGPAPSLAREPERAELPALPPPPVQPAKPQVAEHGAPVPPAPVEPRKPGVFEGRSGFARAALYGLAAGGVAIGTTFLMAAGGKADGARNLGGALQQKAGASPCVSAPSSASVCQQIVDLRQQHDRYMDMALGSFVAAGVMGGVATASIWIGRAPAAPAVQVKLSASRSLTGLSFQGSW